MVPTNYCYVSDTLTTGPMNSSSNFLRRSGCHLWTSETIQINLRYLIFVLVVFAAKIHKLTVESSLLTIFKQLFFVPGWTVPSQFQVAGQTASFHVFFIGLHHDLSPRGGAIDELRNDRTKERNVRFLVTIKRMFNSLSLNICIYSYV